MFLAVGWRLYRSETSQLPRGSFPPPSANLILKQHFHQICPVLSFLDTTRDCMRTSTTTFFNWPPNCGRKSQVISSCGCNTLPPPVACRKLHFCLSCFWVRSMGTAVVAWIPCLCFLWYELPGPFLGVLRTALLLSSSGSLARSSFSWI